MNFKDKILSLVKTFSKETSKMYSINEISNNFIQTSKKKKIIQYHPFHMVDNSPWPFFMSLSAFITVAGLVAYMHSYTSYSFFFPMGLFACLVVFILWWADVIVESIKLGLHTTKVKQGLRMGMLLFIVSEVMFFFAFFWAFFHSSFNPSIFIGAVWPPAHLVVMNPWQIPFLNTVILLFSGASITWAHYLLLLNTKKNLVFALDLTLIAAVIFLLLQAFEYLNAPFNISDSVYGSTFYMATGFHGFHVLIGTIFILVCFFRIKYDAYTNSQEFVGFEAASWYWHFVDVVWLFLFISIYWWGS